MIYSKSPEHRRFALDGKSKHLWGTLLWWLMLIKLKQKCLIYALPSSAKGKILSWFMLYLVKKIYLRISCNKELFLRLHWESRGLQSFSASCHDTLDLNLQFNTVAAVRLIRTLSQSTQLLYKRRNILTEYAAWWPINDFF